MEITLNILTFLLKKKLSIHTTASSYENRPLTNFYFWQGQKFPGDNLYLVPADVYASNAKVFSDCCILLLAPFPSKMPSLPKDCLVLEEELPPVVLSNLLTEAFSGFRGWQQSLLNTEESPEILQNFLDIAHRFLRFPMMIVDSSYAYLAYTLDYYEQNQDWMGDTGYMPMEQLQEMNQLPNYQEAIRKTGVFVYIDEQRPPVLCYNVRLNGIYQARLLVASNEHTYDIGLRSLVGCLGQCLNHAYKKYRLTSSGGEKERRFTENIQLLAQGQKVEMTALDELLKLRGWKIQNSYQVMRFQILDRQISDQSLVFFLQQIEEAWIGSCAFPVNDTIYCLRNLDFAEGTEQDFRKALPIFLRDNLCRCGISNPFRDLTQLKYFCLQADIALSLGSEQRETDWYFFFQDYSFLYLKRQCLMELPASQVCHHALKRLQEYDQKNHTQLYQTLYCYFAEKYNTTKAAQRLFIHRTTLLYRLRQISDLTNLNLDDWNDCLYLMLSFTLMDQ